MKTLIATNCRAKVVGLGLNEKKQRWECRLKWTGKVEATTVESVLTKGRIEGAVCQGRGEASLSLDLAECVVSWVDVLAKVTEPNDEATPEEREAAAIAIEAMWAEARLAVEHGAESVVWEYQGRMVQKELFGEGDEA